MSKPENIRVSYDETVEDMCESCATGVHCFILTMKHGLKLKLDCIQETGGENG